MFSPSKLPEKDMASLRLARFKLLSLIAIARHKQAEIELGLIEQ